MARRHRGRVLPALRGGCLPWDDESNLVTNRASRGLGWAQLGWMLTTFHKGHWIQVTWLSFGAGHLLSPPGGAVRTGSLSEPSRSRWDPSPLAVRLAVILLNFGVYPLRRWKTEWRTRVLEKVPFALLSLLASAVAVVAVRAGGSVSSLADLGVAQRLAISACSLVFYFRKTLLPIGLSPLY